MEEKLRLEVVLSEDFMKPTLDAKLEWLNRPEKWCLRNGELVIEPERCTDFWQRTRYGFQADTGHVLGMELRGDFLLETEVRMDPAHQYDQAGLMVRLNTQCWLKASVEFEEEGPSSLGAVVTNAGYSDWSVQGFSDARTRFKLRIRRSKGDYEVEYQAPEAAEGETLGQAWRTIRVCHLLEDDNSQAAFCGAYACSPKAAGLVARFLYLHIYQPLTAAAESE